MLGRLPHPRHVDAPSFIWSPLLPSLPQLCAKRSSLHGCLWIQCYSQGRDLRPHRRNLWLHRVSEERILNLHLHTQAFVQCYHQFTPLSELVTLSSERQLELLRRYSTYSAHVRRTIYEKPHNWEEEQQDVEADWPENKGCALMVSRPAHQTADAASMTAEEWKLAYLTQDVEELQKRKQHHVHLPSGPNGERRPLNHCPSRWMAHR